MTDAQPPPPSNPFDPVAFYAALSAVESGQVAAAALEFSTVSENGEERHIAINLTGAGGIRIVAGIEPGDAE